MRTFKVIPLALSGQGKKIYNSGDIVTEKNFPSDNLEKLISDGFLKEIIADAKTVTADEVDAELESLRAKCTDKGIEFTLDFSADDLTKLLAESEIANLELENYRLGCTERGIEFDDTDDLNTLKDKIKSFDDAEAELSALRGKCTAKGIEFSDSDESEDLIELLADAEAAEIETQLQKLKNKCLENGISFKEDATHADLNFAINAHFGKPFTNAKGENAVAKMIEDINVKELVKELKSTGIEFNSLDKKPILFSLWMGL